MYLNYFLVFSVIVLSMSEASEDFYELLGVSRSATVKEIRKAFKKLAVKYHPDKNKNDTQADAKFIQMASAYETLKDPETRKSYDLFGEPGKLDEKQKYQSYNYYQNEFGLYDDDALIVTLSKADYEVNILDPSQAWFVNFYSPQCHHCRILAPIWRKLAAELEGVVRIGAVNCEEDWVLCHQLGIHSYPSLLYYEQDSHLHEGEEYRLSRSLVALEDFILSKISSSIREITSTTWEDQKDEHWLLILCPSDALCLSDNLRLKLGVVMEGLMKVGLITDSDLCNKLTDSDFNVLFWQPKKESVDEVATAISGSDLQEIVKNVLNLLPNPDILDETTFKEIRNNLKNNPHWKPWLICFYIGTANDLNLQLKRLPSLLNNINIGLVHCGKSAGLCNSLHINHYPVWAVLKVGGALELHHGRDVLNDVAAFGRDAARSINLHALSPDDFNEAIKEEDPSPWFIDFYAPWCPPCRKLMPELRRASQHFGKDRVQFGTVDCTLHRELCSQLGIQSYPTTVLYNGTKKSYFHGVPNEDGIKEFVQDMISPLVITLDGSSFARLMRKPEAELWLVDYFMPWCGPCQRLAPEWRNLAKQMVQFEQVKIAHVDCEENSDLCTAQNVHSYPTIRMYPLGSKGLNTVAMYNGHRDAVSLKRWIISFLPSPVEAFTDDELRKQVLTTKYYLPWLIDFYAPWCGPCVHFEPEFITVAQRLEGYVRTGKVDCESYRSICRELEVTSYPTVLLFFAPNDWLRIDSQDAQEIIKRVIDISKQRNLMRDEL